MTITPIAATGHSYRTEVISQAQQTVRAIYSSIKAQGELEVCDAIIQVVNDWGYEVVRSFLVDENNDNVFDRVEFDKWLDTHCHECGGEVAFDDMEVFATSSYYQPTEYLQLIVCLGCGYEEELM